MCKYIPTPDLWDPETHEAVVSGKLKLQNGQWVYAGNYEHKSRFVSVSQGGTIIAAHWEGQKDKTTRRYNSLQAVVRRK